MAVKTIPLDEEAYEILNRRRRPGQSYSQIIKAHLGEPRSGTAADLLRNAESYVLSEETLEAIEEQIRSHSQSPARAAKL